MVIGQATDANFEFLIQIIAEAGVVGGIAITVIRFLLTRMTKQLDDAEDARKSDHRQMMLWIAGVGRWMMVFSKQFALHDATVHGINPAAGKTQEERMSNAEKKLDTLKNDFDEAIRRMDAAILELERDRK